MRASIIRRTSGAAAVVATLSLGLAPPAASVGSGPRVRVDASGDPLALGAASYVASPWAQGQGYTWTVGDGTVTEQTPPSQPSGKRATATFTWKLPATVPPAGAKGSLTITATANDNVFAPQFSINGLLVRCTGITNAEGYGTGCADSDHAAAGVSLAANQTQTVTQEFLIQGVPDKVTVVTGAPQNVVYAYALGSNPVVTATPSGFEKAVSVPDPSPGGAAVITSPSLGGLGVISVDASGLSPDDHAVFTAARHECFASFRAALLATPLTDQNGDSEVDPYIQVLAAQIFSRELLLCVAYVDAVEYELTGRVSPHARPANSSAATASSCAATGVLLTASGSHFRSAKVEKKRPGLRVTCTKSGGRLHLVVASTVKGMPLSKVFGAHLKVTIVRGLHAPIGGRIRVVFHKH